MNEAPLRVLYADPDDDSCEMITTMLAFENIRVACVNSVAQTLLAAATETFDLYLLATRFVDGSGFAICSKLRSMCPSTPIVFYSGDARDVDELTARAAGADAYVVKPESSRLAATINRLRKGVLGMGGRSVVGIGSGDDLQQPHLSAAA